MSFFHVSRCGCTTVSSIFKMMSRCFQCYGPICPDGIAITSNSVTPTSLSKVFSIHNLTWAKWHAHMIWHKISCVAVSRTLFAKGFTILVVFSTYWWQIKFELSYIYCNTRAKLSASSYSFCFIITLDRSLKFVRTSTSFWRFWSVHLLRSCVSYAKCKTSTWKQWVKLLIEKLYTGPHLSQF